MTTNFKGFRRAAEGTMIESFKEKNAYAFYTRNVGDEYTLHLSIGCKENAIMQCRLLFDLSTWNDLSKAMRTKVIRESVGDSFDNVFLPIKGDFKFSSNYIARENGKDTMMRESINERGLSSDYIRLRIINLGVAGGSVIPAIGILNVEIFDAETLQWKVYASTMLSVK